MDCIIQNTPSKEPVHDIWYQSSSILGTTLEQTMVLEKLQNENQRNGLFPAETHFRRDAEITKPSTSCRFAPFRRIEFPCFNGDNPRAWIDKANNYFQVIAISEDKKVDLAVYVYFEGDAKRWFDSYVEQREIPNWHEFVKMVLDRFEFKDAQQESEVREWYTPELFDEMLVTEFTPLKEKESVCMVFDEMLVTKIQEPNKKEVKELEKWGEKPNNFRLGNFSHYHRDAIDNDITMVRKDKAKEESIGENKEQTYNIRCDVELHYEYRCGIATFVIDPGGHRVCNQETGALNRTIDHGSRVINLMLSAMIFNVIPTVLETTMVSGILAYKFGAPFAWITSLSVAAYIGFTLVVTQWRTKFWKAINKTDSNANMRAIDSTINYETVKYFNNETFDADKYDGFLERYEDAALKTQKSLGSLNFGQKLIFSSALTTATVLCSNGIMNGSVTVGDLIMVNMLLFQLSFPLYFLGSVYRETIQCLVDMKLMFQLLEEKSEIVDADDVKPLKLNEAGKSVAIVGTSGSGKSTIFRLLFRFFDPHSGHIKIDGQDIRAVTLESLSKSIGVVTQDTMLFNDTIYHNIHYGCLSAIEEEVYDAARRASIHDIIMNFSDKYSTMVGERGPKLSGGEKQRVALARTLVKVLPLLFCDEATSTPDSTTEAEILNALKSLSNNQTLIFIAHRLTTTMQCDVIVVLENGRVVEQRPHSFNEPRFSNCIDWLLENQCSNGSWARPHHHPLLTKNVFSSTLACLLALRKWGVGEEHITRGVRLVELDFASASDESQISPMGFYIVFAGMLKHVRDLVLNLDLETTTLNNLIHKRDLELTRCYQSHSGESEAYLGYVAEGMKKLHKWDSVMNYQRNDGSLFNSPSMSAAVFIGLTNDGCLNYLNSALKKFGNIVPGVYRLDIYARHNLERLGISRYFRDEIQSLLDETYTYWLRGEEEIFIDASTCALALRILQMYGYDLTSDSIAKVLQKDCFSGNIEGIQTALELYRTSELVLCPDESDMEKQSLRLYAVEKHLLEQELCSGLIHSSQHGRNICNEVNHVIEHPFYATMERIENRRNIEHYNFDNTRILKTSYCSPNFGNKDFLYLTAVEDFNQCQIVHGKKLKELERWIIENRLDKLNIQEYTCDLGSLRTRIFSTGEKCHDPNLSKGIFGNYKKETRWMLEVHKTRISN